MRRNLLLLSGFFAATFGAAAQGLPDNPDPGKCYVKCITKDVFEEVEETVEVHPAYTKLEVVPATYKTVEERVLVKEASKKLVYVPAVYETVEVPYIEKEGRTDLEVVPASFGDDTRTFEVYPKTSGWEYQTLEDCPSSNKEDCITACFVEYPAQNQDVAITTLVTDAGTTSVPVGEENATYTKQVIKEPARMDEVEIPAEYATITKQVIETPASTKEVSVPAEYETVTKTVLKKKGGITTWEEIDCELLNPTILPIFYEYNSARLTPDSKTIIDERLLPILREKNVSIELMSHTDSRGNDDYNMALSQQRAESVVNYLVSKGISRSRLLAKGYGETRLVNRCSNGVECSEAEHQRNRRTEFRILGN
ncbi:OmpA family protein [Sinomicrobium weinanense]|uniref:OmpA family protein n=1 Tax=Sinomicrobium weinanense TaxID=2842200 RepID=A0A926JPP0_9FLAO|nr:OmpA family protein [Sinomicrobium weinanense]MBC9795185.1 OmpA family protein [Sinomicrobium weinanense]MBU3121962.1 OmpA family protein [Sinomicrobium weinanense]